MRKLFGYYTGNRQVPIPRHEGPYLQVNNVRGDLAVVLIPPRVFGRFLYCYLRRRADWVMKGQPSTYPRWIFDGGDLAKCR